MKPQQIIKKYLEDQHVMQLATVSNDKPWCATLYFITDETGALYWASLPSRRHSLEIRANPHVAAAIAVKYAVNEKVAGIQIEGIAEEVKEEEAINVAAIKYADRFNRTPQWIEDFTSGRTEHCLYKLTPSSYVLFDESTFPDDPQHEFIAL